MTSTEDLSKAILEFDMKEKHLKGCTNKDTRKSDQQPLFTVKRTFKTKNTGMTPFYVKGFEIEGYLCEGYGFKVLNCEAFNLEPNETREIHIAFTPDFTLSRISRMLTMKTTLKHLEALNYTLVASVPSHMLNLCSKMLPRPYWESYLFWACNVLMAITVIIVICSGSYEADRLVNAAFLAPFLQVDEHGQLLDLRSVADLVHKELSENSPPRLRSTTPQEQIQELRNIIAQQQPSQQQPSAFKRVFASIRGCFRAVGVAAFEIFWKIPSLIPRPRTLQLEDDLEEDVSEAENEVIKQQQPLTQPQQPQSQKKRNKKNLNRKKSITNADAEDTSSTTTESSTIEELEVVNKPPEAKKTNKKKVAPMPNVNEVITASTASASNSASQANKKKAKKQNSVEKKSSPERPKESPNEAKKAKNSNNKKGSEKVEQQPQQPQINHLPVLQPEQPPAQPRPQPQPQQQKKITPVGKIRPEPKKTENLGAQFGAVGTKPMWPQNDTVNGFATVSPVKNPNHYQPLPQNHLDHQPQIEPQPQNFLASGYSNGNSPTRGLGLMAQLQYNRRQETVQFLQNVDQRDWPGFNTNEISNNGQDFVKNLWDSEAPPLRSSAQDPWGAPTIWGDSSNRNPYVGGLSVIGPQQQPQNRLELEQHGHDLLSGFGGQQAQQPNMPQNQPEALGLGSLANISNIWSNGPNQEQRLSNNRETSDELNNQYQQQVMQQQQQQHQQREQPPPRMNNSWSTTLFRNK